jgi:hypothetical protein
MEQQVKERINREKGQIEVQGGERQNQGKQLQARRNQTCLYSLPTLLRFEPQVFLGMNTYFLLYNLYEHRRSSLNRLL